MRSLAAAVVVGALAAAALAQDSRPSPGGDTLVVVENGVRKTRSGLTVESADQETVVVVQGGRRTPIDARDVISIRWGDAPREHLAAVAALEAGDAASAAEGFRAALERRGTPRGWLLEEANAGLGDALLALGPAEPRAAERAAAAFAAARDANPRSASLDRILCGLGRAEILLGKPEAALATAAALRGQGAAAKRPEWEAAAAMLEARAHDAAGARVKALAALDDAAAATTARLDVSKPGAPQQRLRRAAVAVAALSLRLRTREAETSSAPSARDALRSLLTRTTARWTDEPEVAAAAANAEGALHLLAGDARKALRRYLETEVLHFALREDAAAALLGQARCLERLGDAARRADALRRLAEDFPETDAAIRASAR